MITTLILRRVVEGLLKLALLFGFVVGTSLTTAAYASISIDAYPDPMLGATFGGYSPLGEVSKLNPIYSVTPRHDFATYFGQSFVALPGLAQNLTFNIGNSTVTDGIDFRVLIARTTSVLGLSQPTDVIFESGLYTLGANAGDFGASVGGTGRADVTIDLGGIDLVDGVTYAWVLDTVTTVDGLEGYGFVSYRHPDQPDFPGNSTVLVYDLEANRPLNTWGNVSDIDLAYRMEFADGGIPTPEHVVIRSIATSFDSVPEFASLIIWSVLSLVSAVGSMRRRV